MKDSTFVGDAVEVRSLVDLRSVSADGLQRMVVREHEDDVGSLGFGGFIGGGARRDQSADQKRGQQSKGRNGRELGSCSVKNMARNQELIHGDAGVRGGKVGWKRLV